MLKQISNNSVILVVYISQRLKANLSAIKESSLYIQNELFKFYHLMKKLGLFSSL